MHPLLRIIALILLVIIATDYTRGMRCPWRNITAVTIAAFILAIGYF